MKCCESGRCHSRVAGDILSEEREDGEARGLGNRCRSRETVLDSIPYAGLGYLRIPFIG